MPTLLNANLVYDAADRLPDAGVPVVLDLLRRRAGASSLRVAIYGMGEAGKKLRHLLAQDPRWIAPVHFDAQGGSIQGHGVVVGPEQLGQHPEIEVVINTTPPIHLLAVAKTILHALPHCDILSLYDPMAHMRAEQLHYEYWYAAMTPRDLPQPLREQQTLLRDASLGAMHEWHAAMTAGSKPASTLHSLLVEADCSLGDFLEARFREALRQTSAGEGGGVDALVALAEAFPFFSLPRDAAATFLVQGGDSRAAAAVYAPALTRYPFCHQTLAKAAELHLLAGDDGTAQTLLRRAQRLVPAFRPIETLLEETRFASSARRARTRLEARWHGRTVRPAPIPRTTALHIIVPVWGEPYLDTFARITLASLLAEGNLPRAVEAHPVTVAIYTRRQDLAVLHRYGQFKALTDLARVEVRLVEEVLERRRDTQAHHKYSLMSVLQSDGLQCAWRDGAHAFLLLGDFVLSDSFLSSALKHLDQGINTLFFQSLRTVEEAMLQRLAPAGSGSGPLSLESKALLRLGLEHMHPAYRRHFDSGLVPRTPNSFYARTAGGEIVQHTFAQNAMFVRPWSDDAAIHATLDVDLGYESTDGGLDAFHLVRDTADMLFFELTREGEEVGTHLPGSSDAKALAFWIHRHMNPLNRYLGAFSTRFALYQTPPPFCPVQLDLSCAVGALLV